MGDKPRFTMKMVTTPDGDRKPLKDVTEEEMASWAQFATPGMCPFIHDNIKVLYGVEPMARQDLPTKCICGATLTYADEVVFVNKVPDKHDDKRTCHGRDGRSSGT